MNAAVKTIAMMAVTGLLPAQVVLTPDAPTVRVPATGVTVTPGSDGRASIAGFGRTGSVGMTLPALPAGTTETGTVRFPSRVNVQIRQSWSAGAPSVSIEQTAIGRCSRNLDSFECPIDFLEVETTDARRAYIDADVQLDTPGFPRLTIRFRWRIGSSSTPACPAPDQAAAKSSRREADGCPTIASITPGVATNSPSRPYAPANSSQPLRAIIRGENLPSGGTVEISGGIQVNSTTFTSSTQIDVGLSDFRNKPEGPRDVIIKDRNGVQVAIARDLFYVSSIDPRIEINQGVPLDCTASRPCVSHHNTTVRVRLECNGVTASGAPCQTGKTQVTGVLHVRGMKDTAVRPAAAVTVLPSGTRPSNLTLFRGLDTLNFHFISVRESDAAGNQIPIGKFDFFFELDPRNPSSISLTGEANPAKNLVESVADKFFAPSIPSKMRIAAMVDTRDAAENPPSRILEYFEMVRSAYPASHGSIDITVVPSTLTYPNSGDRLADLAAQHAASRAWMSQSSSFTHFVFLTSAANFRMIEGGITGDSSCGVVIRFSCEAPDVVISLNAQDTPASVAHELGHQLLLGDTSDPPAAPNPRVNPLLGPCMVLTNGCPVESGHYDTVTRHSSLGDPNLPSATMRDVMGNSPRNLRWIDKRTWDYLYSVFRLSSAEVNREAASGARAAEASEMVTVRANVNRDGSVSFLPFRRTLEAPLPAQPPEPGTPVGSYTIQIETSNGQILDSRTYEPLTRSGHSLAPVQSSYLSETFVLPAGAARFTVRRDGVERAVRTVSANAPFVQLLSPASGASLDGKVDVQWTGQDPDGDELTYSLLYSADGGTSWIPLVADIKQSSFVWDTAFAHGSQDSRLRVVASDGFHESSSTSESIRVPAKRPFVSIASSADEPLLAPHDVLIATAYDWRDGELPGDAISFSSDRDGALGRGPELVASRLRPGQHRITASVTNRLGLTGESSILVTVAGTGDGSGGGGGTPGGGGASGGGSDLAKITPLTARGWPNERTFDNPPPNAVDGNTNTFTWTTNPNNTVLPSYFGVDFGASKAVSRVRLFKDNDGGGGTLSDHFKNLVIEYTTTAAATALPNRVWTRVTGLANGFNGTELLTAVAVNSDGTVTRDSHNSSANGWASLTFAPVNATGIRIGFSNVTSPTFFNHYKIHEFEAYGPPSGGGSGGSSGSAGNIVGLTMRAGRLEGSVFVASQQIWDTIPNGNFVLGVSLPDTAAPLLNRPDKSVDIAPGTYFIYSEPTTFETAVQLTVNRSNGTREEAVFAPASLSSAIDWTRLTGSANIALASTGITSLNRVSGGLTAGGSNDNVLRLTVGAAGATGGGTPPPSNTGDVLQIDDGTLELVTGFNQGGVQGYFVNRLTPASYPATLRKVIVRFPSASQANPGLPLGSSIQILSAATANTGPQLTGLNLVRTAATITAVETFAEYDVPALTIQSGHFIVGFTAQNPAGVYPVTLDSTSPVRRSYIGIDGATFFLFDDVVTGTPGNFGIRARVEYGGTGGGASGAAAIRVPVSSIAAWPNSRTADNVPSNAIDGNTATFTWTTPAFSNVNPSFLGLGFASAASIARIRLFKDNDSGGAGPVAKNLIIEYTTDSPSSPLPSRTWRAVTGMVNGFQSSEPMTASGVNSNGTVSADNHNSPVSGWASLTFDAVNATGIRVGFSNATPLQQNHYRVYEFEVYGNR